VGRGSGEKSRAEEMKKEGQEMFVLTEKNNDLKVPKKNQRRVPTPVSKEQGMDLNHFKQTLQAEPGCE
jgi:Ca2+-binding EF-hand superfamily protein